MNIHQLFMMLFIPIVIANLIYALYTNTLNQILLGVLTGVVVTILVVGVISSIQILSSGLNASGSWLIFAVSFYLTLLFGVKIPLSTLNSNMQDIPIGANFVGNLFNVLPFPYNLIILVMGIILLFSGINIIIGGRTGG